jgi:hypothetical protein
MKTLIPIPPISEVASPCDFNLLVPDSLIFMVLVEKIVLLNLLNLVQKGWKMILRANRWKEWRLLIGQV